MFRHVYENIFISNEVELISQQLHGCTVGSRHLIELTLNHSVVLSLSLSLSLSLTLSTYSGEGTSVHSHRQSRRYQPQGRVNKSRAARPRTFYQHLLLSIWSQTSSQPTRLHIHLPELKKSQSAAWFKTFKN